MKHDPAFVKIHTARSEFPGTVAHPPTSSKLTHFFTTSFASWRYTEEWIHAFSFCRWPKDITQSPLTKSSAAPIEAQRTGVSASKLSTKNWQSSRGGFPHMSPHSGELFCRPCKRRDPKWPEREPEPAEYFTMLLTTLRFDSLWTESGKALAIAWSAVVPKMATIEHRVNIITDLCSSPFYTTCVISAITDFYLQNRIVRMEYGRFGKWSQDRIKGAYLYRIGGPETKWEIMRKADTYSINPWIWKILFKCKTVALS